MWLQRFRSSSVQNISIANRSNSLPKTIHKTPPSLDTFAFGGQPSQMGSMDEESSWLDRSKQHAASKLLFSVSENRFPEPQVGDFSNER